MSKTIAGTECTPEHQVISSVQYQTERSLIATKKRLIYFPFPLGLLALGLIGNHLTSFRAFVTNCRYVSNASSFVADSLSLFIHIFKYLSEPKSLSAAYQPPDDRCLSTTARRRPPRPVTPETCLRQAAFRAHNESSSSSIGESTRFGGDFERLLFEGDVDVGLGTVGFAVDAALVGDATAAGSFVCAATFFVDAGLGDPILGDEGFEGPILGDDILGAESLDILDLDDDFLIVVGAGLDEGSIEIWGGLLGTDVA